MFNIPPTAYKTAYKRKLKIPLPVLSTTIIKPKVNYKNS